jgi:hypothetical protein
MAAAMSVQWCDLADQLYGETRRLLETENWPQESVPVQRIQAWLLLAHSELLRSGDHHAMLTAGRAFRLVQIARLHDVDAADDLQSSADVANHESDESFINAEERRRAFWLAFSLDRFLCLRNEWPVTLQEDMVRSQLPASQINSTFGQTEGDGQHLLTFLRSARASRRPRQTLKSPSRFASDSCQKQ